MNAAWVERLERRIGFLSAPGLPTFVAGMTALVGVLEMLKPEFVGALVLDPALLLRGQFWRALTFLVVPPPLGPLGSLWLILWVALLYACLRALELAWGDFKFTVFLALGALATAAGALVVAGLAALNGMPGVAFGNSVVILSAFLAFARLMPDRELLVMFVLPVKLRWLAVLAGLWTALDFASSGIARKVEIAAGLTPYFLFFGPGHWRDLRYAWRR